MNYWASMFISVGFGGVLGRLWFLGHHATVIGVCIGCAVACMQLIIAQLSELIEDAILAHERRQAAFLKSK